MRSAFPRTTPHEVSEPEPHFVGCDHAKPIFQVSPHVLFQERGQLEGITLRYFPGVTRQQYTLSCEGVTFTSPAEPLWTAAFVDAHSSEFGDDSVFEAVDWTMHPLNPRAQKFWTEVGSDPALSEVGHFELSHEPGG